MGVPVPKRGGRVASLSSIRSAVLHIRYEYRCTTELSLLQRRGGARKPINVLSQSDWCWNVLRRQSCNLIGAARFSAAERMLNRLATRPPLLGRARPSSEQTRVSQTNKQTNRLLYPWPPTRASGNKQTN